MSTCPYQDLTVTEAVFSVVVELCHVTRGGLFGVVAAVEATDALAGCQVFVEAGALGSADAVDAKNLAGDTCGKNGKVEMITYIRCYLRTTRSNCVEILFLGRQL